MKSLTLKQLCDRYALPNEILDDIGNISDGYHTYNSLYEQRRFLFAALVNTFPEQSWKSLKHSDGEACFDGKFFIVAIDTPQGSYSYHYELEYWDMYHCKALDVAKVWDGHTDKDVSRLLSLTAKPTEIEETKNSMTQWATREIELLCHPEMEEMDEYFIMATQSALDAYKSLMADGHSGYSIGITQSVLNRLIDGKPLSSIKNDDVREWRDVSGYDQYELHPRMYQHIRMNSLFKYVDADGKASYSDIEYAICVDVDTNDRYFKEEICTWIVQREIVDKMFPITFPYEPTKSVKIYCTDFLTDSDNGDFDTVGVLYAVMPDNKIIHIDRYFKEEICTWIEIDHSEYATRVSASRKKHSL